MYKNGVEVRKLQVVNLIRDWSKHQVKKSKDYPECQVSVQNVPLWPEEKTMKYIYGRVKLHQNAEDTLSDDLPKCTPEERWERPIKYAVMKIGRKSALRLLESQKDADKYIEDKNLDDKHYIDVRQGESVRCESYCNVSPFCNQYQNSLLPF